MSSYIIILPSGNQNLCITQDTINSSMYKYLPELFTPLMAACASSRESEDDMLECVDLLLSYGAKVDVAERHRMTPLMFASKEGRVSIVQRLINAKVDVNKQDNRGLISNFYTSWLNTMKKILSVNFFCTSIHLSFLTSTVLTIHPCLFSFLAFPFIPLCTSSMAGGVH